MSRQINQPINQVKLTNVAVVRCNKAGKRFEIACYRNKVMDYRSGLEKDLSEVLQAERIFTNVSKGQFAKTSDLKKAFGTTDEEIIAKVILEEGNSIQVSELERNQQLQNTVSQIASWVASNCVHPEHGRPYTVSQIKHALGKNFTVQTHKPLKKQCLDAVKFLKQEIPIERAKMELSLTYDASHHETVSQTIDQLDNKHIIPEKSKGPTNVHDSSSCVLVVQVDPSLYRELDELSKTVHGQLEILQQVVSVEGDVDLDKEIERKKQSHDSKGNNSNSGIADHKNAVKEAADAIVQLDLNDPGTKEGHEQDSESSDNSDSDDSGPALVDRKNQKKAARKAKKAQRRKDYEDTHESITQDQATPHENNRRADDNDANNNKTSTSVDGSSGGSGGAPGKSCNTCGGSFASASDYRAHFRSDWHRFNQKLKLQGMTPVSEEEFKLCDAETFFGQYTS